jgi:phage tail protein X
MKLPMFKRLATDVAPQFAALLAFVVCALALGLLMNVTGANHALQHWGQSLQNKLDPSFPRDEFSQL